MGERRHPSEVSLIYHGSLVPRYGVLVEIAELAYHHHHY
jgi:hypothetical protein